MKQYKPIHRLLSLVLSLSMVLGLVLGIIPGLDMAALAAFDLLSEEEMFNFSADFHEHQHTKEFRFYANNTDSYATVKIESGSADKPNTSRFWCETKVDIDLPISNWIGGLLLNMEGYAWNVSNTPDVDMSDGVVTLEELDSITMTGGNIGQLNVECDRRDILHPLFQTIVRTIMDINLDISGGKIGELKVTDSYRDANIKIRNAQIGTVYCVDVNGYVVGDVKLTISDSTVGDIHLAHPIGAKVPGGVHLVIENSSVGNIIASAKGVPNDNTGYITSGKLDNPRRFKNLFYKNGTAYILRGDVNSVYGNRGDLTVQEGETLRFEGDATFDEDIYNYGTMYVTPGVRLKNVVNYGTLIVTGEMNIGELTNLGKVDFTGSIGSGTTVINNTGNGIFYCHGNHNGWSKVSNFVDGNSSRVICDNPGCTLRLPTGATILPWKANFSDSNLADIVIVNASHGPNDWVTCNDTYRCTFQTTESYYLLPKTITVELNGTKMSPSKTTYEYNSDTGEFVLYYTDRPVKITAIRSLARRLQNQSSTAVDYAEAKLDQYRYLYDGTEKLPKVVSVVNYHSGKAETLVEGVDFTYKHYNNVDEGTATVRIFGQGKWYQGSFDVNFEIYRHELTEEMTEVVLEEGPWTYTAAEIKPAVKTVTLQVRNDETGKEETVTLLEGKDYRVSYEENIHAGTGKVVITGVGSYKGSVSREFTIEKGSIKNVTVANNVNSYTGEVQELDARIYYNGVLLTEGVDYTLVKPSGMWNIGSQDVTIYAKGDNFISNQRFTFPWSIVERSLEGKEYEILKYGGDLVYNGHPQTPKDWVLEVFEEDGSSYFVGGTWSKVTNVTDSITFTAGAGGESGTVVFDSGVMAPRDMMDVSVYPNKVIYNGEAQSPELRVYLSSPSLLQDAYFLVEGVDYTLSGTTSATEPGTYLLTINGIGNFTGSKSVQWEVSAVDIGSRQLTVGEGSSLIYNGSDQTPDHKLYWTDAKGVTMEIPGSWSQVMDVEDVAIFTPASEYFMGSYELSNVIAPLDITEGVCLDDTYDYCGSAYEGKAYLPGFDFTGTTEFDRTPVNVGTYTATITGTGNFTGTTTRTLTIEPAPLEVVLNLEDKFYDGTKDVVLKEIFIEGGRGEDEFTVDASELVIDIPSADAGFYTTAGISGLKVTCDNMENYVLNDTTASLAALNYSGFSINPSLVYINAREQSLIAGEAPAQDAWELDWEFDDRFDGCTVNDVVLTADLEELKVVPSGGKVVRFEDGVDITKNFRFIYNRADLFLLCDHHQPDQDGFCHNCDGFEAAERFDNGTPEEAYDDYYQIRNAGQLYWFAQQVNSYSMTWLGAKLMADIEVPDSVSKGGNIPDWTPIDYLYADFDGCGHSVSGLYTKSEDTYAGFFGSTGYYPVRNLTLKNCYFEGSGCVGGIAGYNQGEIVNCVVASDVVLAGANEYTDIGGIVGNNTGIVDNCYTALDAAVGYMNSSYGTVENCYFQGTEDDSYGCIAKTAEDFASGEVAYLLQSAVPGEDIYDEDYNWIGTAEPRQIWGQTIGKDAYPAIGGWKVYQVTDCQGQVAYSNNDQNGHIYVDGICIVCGAEDPNYVIQPTITLEFPTLSFKDEVLMNVYFSVVDSEDVVDFGLITYDSQVDNPTVHNAKNVIAGYEYSQENELYRVTTGGIPAKNMDDDIWFAVYAKLRNGSYTYSKLVSYSATQYANTLLGSGNAKLDALLVSMLNYGAAAQLQFNQNPDDLMNKHLTPEQQALVESYRADMMPNIPAPDTAKQGSFVGNGGYKNRGPSVSFKGAFMINYYYEPSYRPVDGITLYYWLKDDFEKAEVLTEANATGTMKMEENANGTYKASVSGIAAKNIGDGVYVAIVYSDGTTTYSSGILPYSVGMYCNQTANGTEIAQLARATAVYGYYAKNYFNQ